MAKAPVPGQAKTRLIPALGAEGAARLHRRLTLHALQIAQTAAPGAVTLFTAGDAEHPFWTECRCPGPARADAPNVVVQRGAHLGARMQHALQLLLRTHDRAALIGTDCAVLRPGHLAELCAALDCARMAFIPAEDGGYVAVAAREIAAAGFGALDWGTDRVMQQTRDALARSGWQAGKDWSELPALWDIDRPEDLVRVKAEGLAGIPVPG